MEGAEDGTRVPALYFISELLHQPSGLLQLWRWPGNTQTLQKACSATAAHWSLGKKLGQSKRSEWLGGLCGQNTCDETRWDRCEFTDSHLLTVLFAQSRKTSQDCLHLSPCFRSVERNCRRYNCFRVMTWWWCWLWTENLAAMSSALLWSCIFSVNADVKKNDDAETWQFFSVQKLKLDL